jgi:hypothetical protein
MSPFVATLACLAASLLAICAYAQTAQPWDEFPISYWMGPQVGFNTLESWQAVKDCNFTFAGPACWRPKPGETVLENKRMLDLCQQVGLKAMVVDDRINWAMTQDDDWRGKLARVVADYGSHPALWGYYVQDEPNHENFRGLSEVYGELVRLDPKHAPYINLFPTYASVQQLGTPTYADHLERFLNTVHPMMLSYDHYCLMAGGKDRPDFFENLELIREAALRHGIPAWNIIQACSWTPAVRVPNAAEMRWQVYTSLAYGIKGILYFVYWTWESGEEHSVAIVDAKGQPGPLYPVVKQLNAEMRTLGPTLVGLTSTGVFHTGPTIPTACRRLGSDAILQVPSDVPLVVGFLQDAAGAQYAFIANRDHDNPVDFEARVKGHVVGAAEVSANDGQEKPVDLTGGKFSVHLEAGDGRLLRLHTQFAYPQPPEALKAIDFHFDGDAGLQGWGGFHSLSAATVADGALTLTFTGGDPYMIRSYLRIAPDQYSKLRVRMKLPPGHTEGQVFWTTATEPAFRDDKYLNFPVQGDGQWHDYTIPVGEHPKWRGQAIRALRLDPTAADPQPGTRVQIAWIVAE